MTMATRFHTGWCEKEMRGSTGSVGVGILADHLDVATERDRAEHVLGAVDGAAEQARPEADRELEHADAGALGDDEMAELVHDDEHAEDDDGGKHAA